MADEIKVCLRQSISVKGNGDGYLVPFAQQALPIALLGGLPFEYREALQSSMYHMIELVYGYLLEKLGEDLTAEQSASVHNNKDGVRDILLRYFEDRLSQDFGIMNPDDISRMVAYLSKEDVAELAEALVHLTQLKLKVSPEHETVGGPIDVAVISKGDGLIWIKRKHYFERELIRATFHQITQT